jgi:hypothetical protein
VKRSTRLVSRPNHTRGEIEWKLGTVSKIVTIAENTMREVDAKWTRKADEDDVGDSSKSKRARFHGEVMGSGGWSNDGVVGNTSSTSLGDCSSVRNLDAAGDLKRERGIG